MRVAAEKPDFTSRSALAIAPGRWRMRNGHIAQITHQKWLEYESAGKNAVFPIWFGRCIECNEHCTWNLNGTCAAVGKHAYDILVAA